MTVTILGFAANVAEVTLLLTVLYDGRYRAMFRLTHGVTTTTWCSHYFPSSKQNPCHGLSSGWPFGFWQPIYTDVLSLLFAAEYRELSKCIESSHVLLSDGDGMSAVNMMLLPSQASSIFFSYHPASHSVRRGPYSGQRPSQCDIYVHISHSCSVG